MIDQPPQPELPSLPASPTQSTETTRPAGLRARWLVASVLALAAVIAFDLSNVASAAAVRPVGAGPINGEIIGHNPHLRVGSTITLSVRGFAPAGPASARLTCADAAADTVTADRSGAARLTVRVPNLPAGQYELVISGAGPVEDAVRTTTASETADGTGNVVATVPRVARYPFMIDSGGTGVGGSSNREAARVSASTTHC